MGDVPTAILLAAALLTLYLCTPPPPEEEEVESVLRREEGPLLAVAVASLRMIIELFLPKYSIFRLFDKVE